MKKSILMFAFAGFTILTACNSHDSTAKTETKETEKTADVYTCPMHPEVVSDKPGVCPKCNMDLVKKENK